VAGETLGDLLSGRNGALLVRLWGPSGLRRNRDPTTAEVDVTNLEVKDLLVAQSCARREKQHWIERSWSFREQRLELIIFEDRGNPTRDAQELDPRWHPPLERAAGISGEPECGPQHAQRPVNRLRRDTLGAAMSYEAVDVRRGESRCVKGGTVEGFEACRVQTPW